MKHDDEMVLKEIQKNTQMGMTAIDTILDKIGNDEFSITLSRQSLHYADIHNRALDRILKEDGEGYRSSQIGEMVLKGSIHANTAFNISTEHLAEMMIQAQEVAMAIAPETRRWLDENEIKVVTYDEL